MELGTLVSIPDNGLAYKGTVTVAAPVANQFTIPTLAGLGAGRFYGATNPFYAVVVQKGSGTSGAPQGEQQVITAYNNTTGQFTTSPFTVPVAVGDQVQIMSADLAANPAILSQLTTTGAWVIYPGITVAPAGTLTINNNALVIGDVNVGTGGSLTINGDCQVMGDFLANNDGVGINILGDLYVAGTFIQALVIGGGTSGGCYVNGKITTGSGCSIRLAAGASLEADSIIDGGNIQLGAGSRLNTSGDFQVASIFQANADGVSITILGDCSIAGGLTLGGGTSGTMTVQGNGYIFGGTTINVGATCVINGIGYLYGGITNNGTLTYNSPPDATKVNQELIKDNNTGLFNGATDSLHALEGAIASIIAGSFGDTMIYMGITVAPAGTLTLNNSALVIGNITVGAGATLRINGNCLVTGLISNSGTFNVLGNFAGGPVTQVGAAAMSVVGDCESADFTNNAGNLGVSGNLTTPAMVNTTGTILVYGNFQADLGFSNTTGTITVWGSCVGAQIVQTGAGHIRSYGLCQIAGITNSSSGDITLGGNSLSMVIQNTSTGIIVVGGECQIGTFTNNGGGSVTLGVAHFSGNITNTAASTLTCDGLICAGDLTANANGVTITVNDDCSIAGVLTLGGGVSGTMMVTGSMKVTALTLAAKAMLSIKKNCQLDGSIAMGAGARLTVAGNCFCGDELDAANDSLTIQVNGNFFIFGGFGGVNVGGGVSGGLIVGGDLTVGNNTSVTLATGASLSCNLFICGSSIACAGTITGELHLIGAGLTVDFTGSTGAGSISKLVSNDAVTLLNMSGDTIPSIQLGDAAALAIAVSCTAGAVTIYGTGSAVNSSFGAGVIMTDKRLSIHVLP